LSERIGQKVSTTQRVGNKTFQDKTYRLQNVSATESIGDKRFWLQKRIGCITNQLHTVSSTKHIGDNV
jgi:hypothetical protein